MYTMEQLYGAGPLMMECVPNSRYQTHIMCQRGRVDFSVPNTGQVHNLQVHLMMANGTRLRILIDASDITVEGS